MNKKTKRKLHLYIRLLEIQLADIGSRIEVLETAWGRKENLMTLHSVDSKLTNVFKQCLFESSIMGLCRISDPSDDPEEIRRRRENEKRRNKSKRGYGRNLNIRLLLYLIRDSCDEPQTLCLEDDFDRLSSEMYPVRLRRNKIIGHTDLLVSVKPDSMIPQEERMNTKVTIPLLRSLYDSSTLLLNQIRSWHSGSSLTYDSYMERRVERLCKILKSQQDGGINSEAAAS